MQTHFLLESQRALDACFGAYFLKLEQAKKQRMDFFYLWLSTQTDKRRTSLLESIVRAQFAQYGISFKRNSPDKDISCCAANYTNRSPTTTALHHFAHFWNEPSSAESAGSDSKLHNACSSKNQTHVL